MLHTKTDFETLLTGFLIPLKTRYTKEKAGLILGNTAAGYETHTIGLEGFSRILWGLVPAWSKNSEQLKEFQEIYRKGLSAGTNPESSEYWGICHDYDQRFVEMAAIAYGMMMAPEVVWKPLRNLEKENLANWLYQINDHELPLCNWEFFRVLVNLALKKCGKHYSAEKLEYSLHCVESFYIGSGWYQDGDSKQTDYYVPWAMHFYGLIYAIVMEEEDPERSLCFKERAKEFAKEFIYWFADQGAALPYGRSLTYRFAQCSFFSALVIADVRPFPLEVMKGIIVRNFEYWQSQEILDNAGILSIGYSYSNLHMAESYNSPGSPYWALKAFAILGLPKEHEFWSVPAKALPSLEGKKWIPSAEMIMVRQGGEVFAYTPGNYSNFHAHAASKYGKFVYSTKFGFSTPKTNLNLGEAAPDSTLVFEIDGYYLVKRKNESSTVDDNQISCKWSPFTGIHVETVIVPDQYGHKRVHTITSEIDCIAYDCAFAVAIEEDEIQTKVVNRQQSEMREEVACALAANSTASCSISSAEGEAIIIWAAPNTNLVANKTVIPAIKYWIHPGITIVESRIETRIG